MLQCCGCCASQLNRDDSSSVSLAFICLPTSPTSTCNALAVELFWLFQTSPVHATRRRCPLPPVEIQPATWPHLSRESEIFIIIGVSRWTPLVADRAFDLILLDQRHWRDVLRCWPLVIRMRPLLHRLTCRSFRTRRAILRTRHLQCNHLLCLTLWIIHVSLNLFCVEGTCLCALFEALTVFCTSWIERMCRDELSKKKVRLVRANVLLLASSGSGGLAAAGYQTHSPLCAPSGC